MPRRGLPQAMNDAFIALGGMNDAFIALTLAEGGAEADE